ncbi:conjugative transfer ATPase [Vibrio agarivorans]|uniref:Conjugative transfer ATPase n=1 Tax=Vibrio agarivorans TaxID=153622 RepID=A0ABT7Y7H3_9VIBR|nr:conjugative transfer ATPase [Vibrio agarivorans]MDN2483945.1 conjugative transfer ATPase [Vibrio agarivorans]
MGIVQQLSDFINGTVLQKSMFSQADEDEMYDRAAPSFAEKLPYCAFDDETETFILEDGISRAAVFTFNPISTVGKTPAELAAFRNAIEAVYDKFESRSTEEGQWVIQEFTYNDNRIKPIMQKMRDYVRPHARGTQFTEEYLRIQEHHLRGISKEGGIFTDREVTGQSWGLKIPRTKFIVYRRVVDSDLKKMAKGRFDPAQELNQQMADLETQFRAIGGGLSYKRDSKKDVLFWLYRFFNPNPDIEIDKETFYDRMTDIEGEGVIGPELCESLVNSRPISSVEENCWTFDNVKMRFLRFSGLRQPPRVGQMSGEVSTGKIGSEVITCCLDSLPDGSMLAKTVVFVQQKDLEDKLAGLAKTSKTSSTESARARKLLAAAEKDLIEKGRAVRCTMGVYISADNLDDLDDRQRQVITVMGNNSVSILKDDQDGLSLDSFLIHLPMNFKPKRDKKHRYLRLMQQNHAANLSFFFGRSEGSGNPGLMFYNRGGAPVFHDPMNGKERAMNAFQFVIGPPGSGKSVTLSQMAIMSMAIHRPRLFVVEYGNSFGLLGDYFKRNGLTVNKMKLDMANAPSLAPFADLDIVLQQEYDIAQFEDWDLEGKEVEVEEDSDIQDEERDVLGELELITFLMITGGEEREYERYGRADRQLVRDALVKTAERMRKGSDTPKAAITQDIIDTLKLMANGEYPKEEYTDKQKEVLLEMVMALKGYTQGFNAKLFNRPGEAWPDADVTIVDLAELAKDANKDKLAVAFTSLLQQVNYLAEQFQSDPREIQFLVDECHLVLSNPLISPYLIKVVKCFRKLSTWITLATQNTNDCSGASRKLLSMIEWYYALNTPSEEAREIQKVKGLSSEDTYTLTTTRKQARAYTEGVIVSKNYTTLFRSVPPSLYLALAMTEGHEKADRRAEMEKHKCDEATSAYYIARKLDKNRGFEHELEIVH